MPTRFIIATLVWVGSLLAFSTNAQKRYTAMELQQMMDAGQAPIQEQGGPPSKIQSLPFSSCVPTVDGLVNNAMAQYPVKILVAAESFYIAKVWASDDVTTYICNQSEGTLTVLTHKYR